MKKVDLKQLSIEERLRLICGKDFWHTCDFDGKIQNVRVSDASMGVRMPINPDKWDGDKQSVAYPSIQMLTNTWDAEIVREYATCVADDCLDMGVDILLGPGVNIKTVALVRKKLRILFGRPLSCGDACQEYVMSVQKRVSARV